MCIFFANIVFLKISRIRSKSSWFEAQEFLDKMIRGHVIFTLLSSIMLLNDLVVGGDKIDLNTKIYKLSG